MAALAAVVTVVMAAPVLRSPSERVFGNASVGRHHDPFTVMQQFERPVAVGVYTQPVTDIPGALIARVSGGVAAYNWLVLLSFPLAAVAAYLLARHLALSPVAAAVAAMAYAFSPFHLAHAAYHPHIAQAQWIPLYLLALWRCLDRATPWSVGLLAAAAIAVTLSNFYGGLIAAVITPAAVAAYWLAIRRGHAHATRSLTITVGALALIAVSGVAYAVLSAGAVVANPEAFAFPRADAFRYSATWLSYLVPPVAHPLLGDAAARFWAASGVGVGLLEQQVSLGWGVIALGAIAVASWMRRRDNAPPRAAVPLLAIVAAVAFLFSLSPELAIGPITLARPSAWLYDAVPMFRSYARFGLVVQLMAALLAGLGVDALRRAGTGRASLAVVTLVVLAAAEYAVLPSALGRDVLPTTAHRWVMQQPGVDRTLDCLQPGLESATIPWLTGARIGLLDGATIDCTDPDIAPKLLAAGYSRLIVRRDTPDGQWFAEHPLPDGLRTAARFDDAQVLAVAAPAPVYTAEMIGFFPRERDAEWSWRWMGLDAVWTIVNTRDRPVVAAVGLDLSAFHRPRQVEIRLDGRPVQTLVVEPARRVHQVGPFVVPPGGHALSFHPTDAPTVAREVIANGDPRPLSFALGTWRWTVHDDLP